jgi:hypothetical protein
LQGPQQSWAFLKTKLYSRMLGQAHLNTAPFAALIPLTISGQVIMKAVWLASALALGIFFFSAPDTATAQEARNLGEFCAVWQRVCNRTCPGGGNCASVCRERVAQCQSSGCFHFNSPEPRCFNNASDRGLTNLRLAPNPEQERKRRGYYAARSKRTGTYVGTSSGKSFSVGRSVSCPVGTCAQDASRFPQDVKNCSAANCRKPK